LQTQLISKYILICLNLIVEMIGKIWRTAEGKHESTLSAIYGFFEIISASMNIEAIDYLF